MPCPPRQCSYGIDEEERLRGKSVLYGINSGCFHGNQDIQEILGKVKEFGDIVERKD